MYSMLTFLYKVVEKIKVFEPYEYIAYLEGYNEKVLLKNSNTSVYFFTWYNYDFDDFRQNRSWKLYVC